MNISNLFNLANAYNSHRSAKVAEGKQSEFKNKKPETIANRPTENFNITLRMGYLVSEGNPISGQELHMKYDKNSTKEDPIMFVIGKDINGKEFETTIHINDIDPSDASLLEMKALDAHIMAQPGYIPRGSCIDSIQTKSFGHTDSRQKQNFTQLYEAEISKFRFTGYYKEANNYTEQLKNYLLFANNYKERQ